MKKILFLASLLITFIGFGQTQYAPLGSPFGNNINRVNAPFALQLPRGADTSLKGSLDTVGMLFYKTADTTLWLRVPKISGVGNHWVKIANGNRGVSGDTLIYFKQNGNSFGTNATLGTNDGYGINFKTQGTNKIGISSSGDLFSINNGWIIGNDGVSGFGDDGSGNSTTQIYPRSLLLYNGNYINFGTQFSNTGRLGFGLRDSLGHIQKKDSLGVWGDINSGSSGNTIYTGDGSITTDRTINMKTNNLQFDSIASFGLGNFLLDNYTSVKRHIRTPTPASNGKYLPISVNGNYAISTGEITDTAYRNYIRDSISLASQWKDTTNGIYYASNVGIGMINPSFPLDIQGTGTNTGYGFEQLGITSPSSEAGLFINNTGTGGVSAAMFTTNNGSGVGGGNLVIGDVTTGTNLANFDLINHVETFGQNNNSNSRLTIDNTNSTLDWYSNDPYFKLDGANRLFQIGDWTYDWYGTAIKINDDVAAKEIDYIAYGQHNFTGGEFNVNVSGDVNLTATSNSANLFIGANGAATLTGSAGQDARLYGNTLGNYVAAKDNGDVSLNTGNAVINAYYAGGIEVYANGNQDLNVINQTNNNGFEALGSGETDVFSAVGQPTYIYGDGGLYLMANTGILNSTAASYQQTNNSGYGVSYDFSNMSGNRAIKYVDAPHTIVGVVLDTFMVSQTTDPNITYVPQNYGVVKHFRINTYLKLTNAGTGGILTPMNLSYNDEDGHEVTQQLGSVKDGASLNNNWAAVGNYVFPAVDIYVLCDGTNSINLSLAIINDPTFNIGFSIQQLN